MLVELACSVILNSYVDLVNVLQLHGKSTKVDHGYSFGEMLFELLP
jgi:hypothetical protein